VKEAVRTKEKILLIFFGKIKDEETIPPNAKPVVIDLKSMYSNNPIEEGLEAF
jgi:hypothetical protein